MNIRHQFQPTKSVEELFKNNFENNLYAENNLLFLVDLVQVFRPKKPLNVEVVSIRELILFIENNPKYSSLLKIYFNQIVKKNKFSRLLSEACIINNNHFLTEVKKRIFEKFLPYQPDKDTLQFVLNQVFYLESDSIWINKISNKEIVSVFNLLELNDIYKTTANETSLSEVFLAMQLLAQRISGRALENDVIKMVPEFSNLESPFIAFEKELSQAEQIVRNTNEHSLNSTDLIYKQLLMLHKQCDDYIDKAFLNSSKYGISLSVNQSLLRIRQQLLRLKELMPFIVVNKEEDKLNNSIQIVLELIKYNCTKNNLKSLFNESTQLIAFEITQHTARTGQKYVTDSYGEYFKMFFAAAGGGLIVGFLCVFKLLFSNVDTSAFGHAFLYSFNYAFGFVAIFLLGFTLATKQPAMTAARIAQVLDDGMKNRNTDPDKHKAFANLYSKIFRTQFIAFIGNVLIAFPVSLLIVWVFQYFTGFNFAASKADKLIDALNPIYSLALFHAAIAGVFLFISGIISGSVSNRNKHNQVPYRIKENPFLKQILGVKRTIKLANWVDLNWAGVVSNTWFGIFLGSTASVGVFLGLNIDIRHITFASGNFALGLYGNGFNVNSTTIFWSVLGVGLIGFVNFIVSFTLSLLLAFRSRNIPLTELHLLNKSIWHYFLRKPFHFFLPIKDSIMKDIKNVSS
ncbi:recombinase [Flavobacterium sp.]|jgi:site-specific recombinase|uniref:site-specific recombinase n=1 Tax=Flavobacterium sp. TaxID=239 RepID=UPI002A82BBEF|nr:recombinase [Flavobacterium sp.]